LLIKSTNKTKTTWNIINENINKRPQKHDIHFININGTKTHDSQVIGTTFNTYFSTVAQNIHTENFNSVDENYPRNYLYNAFKQPIPATKTKFATSREIESVVNSLKQKVPHGYDGIPTETLKQVFHIFYHL
jgi:hypothetical protein